MDLSTLTSNFIVASETEELIKMARAFFALLCEQKGRIPKAKDVSARGKSSTEPAYKA
jgi:isopenicillin N synthase-like dioxygenase